MFSSNSTKLQPEKIFTHVIKLPFIGMHSIQMVKFLHSEEIAERQKKRAATDIGYEFHSWPFAWEKCRFQFLLVILQFYLS